MKLTALLFAICLGGCSTSPQAPIIPLQIVNETLDLSEYKTLTIESVNGNICYSYDDFSKSVELLNKLKDYIEYQHLLINKLDNYYNPKNKK
jgi:hypothetical protein